MSSVIHRTFVNMLSSDKENFSICSDAIISAISATYHEMIEGNGLLFYGEIGQV